MTSDQHNQGEQQLEPGQAEQSDTGQAGPAQRSLDEWQRIVMSNLNRMAADEQYRREVTARQS